uniref:Uncharacterized protein n=1 Tax=Timema shepardi TaxID=629360 RepID=A0A7R9B790_TIMSH|nr:unnamed protein product [Timema shepardi]
MSTRASSYMNGCSRVSIRLLVTAIVHLVVVERPQPLIGVLMSPDLQIHTMLLQLQHYRNI